MKRQSYIVSGDERIPRAAANGFPPTYSDPEVRPAHYVRVATLFDLRVENARGMLTRGIPKDKIVEKHGSIVLRAALKPRPGGQSER